MHIKIFGESLLGGATEVREGDFARMPGHRTRAKIVHTKKLADARSGVSGV